jgi:hypothetical protein
MADSHCREAWGLTQVAEGMAWAGRDVGAQLPGYFDGTQHAYPGVHAFPAEGLRVPVFVLATGAGADLAAELGLPLVLAAVRGERRMLETIARYRERFAPSAWSPYPYVVVSATVAVAVSSEEAVLVPEAWSAAYSRTRRVPAPAALRRGAALDMTDRERRLFTEARQGQIRGTEAEVARELRGLVDRSGAEGWRASRCRPSRH